MLDVESFTALLTDCYQHCWVIAAAVTGDRAEADDVVQEASLIALRKLADFTVGTNFSAWISHIVRLTALNHLKKSGRRHVVVTDPATIDGAQVPAAAYATVGAMSITEDGQVGLSGPGPCRAYKIVTDDELLEQWERVGVS